MHYAVRILSLGLAAAALTTGCSEKFPTEPAQFAVARGGPKSIPVNGRIYFSSLSTGQLDLYSMKEDGSDRRRITFTNDVDERLPDVSPDGKKLAYLAKGPSGLDIYTINTDGTGTRRVTFYDADPNNFFSLHGPRWSPDGRKIAFSNLDPASGGYSAAYTINPTGGQAIRITDPAVTGSVIDPEFSPDGVTMIVSAFNSNTNTFDLLTLPAAGGAVANLGGCVDQYCYRPTWSPDGSRIFVETNQLRIFVYQMAPSPWSGLLIHNGSEVYGGALAFAPDGSRFVYSDALAFTTNVRVMDVNGYNMTSIAGSMSIGGMAWGR